MKRRILFGFLWMVPSYFVGLFGCLWLLPIFTGNAHDSSVEAAMTGAFVFGPFAAIAGFLVGAVASKRKSLPPNGSQQQP